MSFADDGRALASTDLSDAARQALGLDREPPFQGLREAHKTNPVAHRARYGF